MGLVQVLGTAGVDVEGLCITPRTPEGLIGLITSPFVHKSWPVLLSNLLGLWTLGFLLLMQGQQVFCVTYLWISVVGGLVTFSLARPGTYCGSAGELCGFFSFLVLAAIWQRPISMKTLISLIITLFLYGGSMLLSLLSPTSSSYWHSSWESKLFGLLAGAIWALIFFKWLLRSPKIAGFFYGHDQSEKKTTEQPIDPEAPKSTSEAASSQPGKPSKKAAGGFGFMSNKKPDPPLHTQENCPSPAKKPSAPLYAGYDAGTCSPYTGGLGTSTTDGISAMGYPSHQETPQAALDAVGGQLPQLSCHGSYFSSMFGQQAGAGGWGPSPSGAWRSSS